MQQSTCSLHSSAKALQLFPPDADILYKEIVEQIVIQQSQQAEKEADESSQQPEKEMEKVQTPKKQKEKKEKKVRKEKKTKKEKKESDHEKGKEKEKKPKVPKKKERLPSITEEGPVECSSAPDQKGETEATISKKFQHMLTIKERKKKKRHSILFN